MTAQEQSEAVVNGLAGAVSVTGRRWWHLRPTTITLTAEQMEHFSREWQKHHIFETLIASGIDFAFKCCNGPCVEFSGTSQVRGFKPRVTFRRLGCPRCGWLRV